MNKILESTDHYVFTINAWNPEPQNLITSIKTEVWYFHGP